jgi:hypothetical protein
MKIAEPPARRRPDSRVESDSRVAAGRPRTPGSSTKPTVPAEAIDRDRISRLQVDRDQMLDRLQHLRTILPVFAQELATARRHAAQLRRDNRRLLEEVHRLQRQHVERTTSR